jgi:hypothetical protein
MPSSAVDNPESEHLRERPAMTNEEQVNRATVRAVENFRQFTQGMGGLADYPAQQLEVEIREAIKTSTRPTPDALRVAREALVEEMLAEIPANWCDPLLTGDTAAISKHAGKWGCTDIEQLLNQLKERMKKKALALLAKEGV